MTLPQASVPVPQMPFSEHEEKSALAEFFAFCEENPFLLVKRGDWLLGYHRALRLQSAQQASELSAAERDALERAVQARQAELRLREHHPDNAIQTEHRKRRDLLDVAEAIRSHAVDALLALRARGER